MEKAKIAHRQGQSAELSRRPQDNGGQSRTITKEMTVREVIQNYPKTLPLFLEKGVYCIGCPIAQFETIEDMAKAYGFDLEKFLEDLNKTAKEK